MDINLSDAVIYFHDVARKLANEGDGELARDIRVIADRLNQKTKWTDPESLDQIRRAT